MPAYPPIRSVPSVSPRQNVTMSWASGTGAAKRARTVRSGPAIVIVTGLVVVSRSPVLIPDQPANTLGAVGVAVRVTGCPSW